MFKLLRFLRITDENDILSLTNILIMVVTTKIIMSPVLDYPTLIGLLLTLLGYHYKRTVNSSTKQSDSKVNDLSNQMTDLNEVVQDVKQELASHKDKISSLSSALGFKDIYGK